MIITKVHPTWVIGVIFLLVMFRLLPHPPNFTPIAAMALFSGAMFANRWLAYVVPLVAMSLSDLVIGIHSTIFYVYAGMVIIVLIGSTLNRISFLKLCGVALIASVVFYFITNFGSWLHHDLYSKDFSGLIQAYIAGLPFFRNSILANLLFTYLLFYGLKLFSNAQQVSPVK